MTFLGQPFALPFPWASQQHVLLLRTLHYAVRRQLLVVSIVGTEKISFFQTHASKNEVSIDQTVKSMIASTFLSQTNLLCNIFVGHNEKCCREESGGWLVNTGHCLAAARCNLTNDNKHEITIEMFSVQATAYCPPATGLHSPGKVTSYQIEQTSWSTKLALL